MAERLTLTPERVRALRSQENRGRLASEVLAIVTDSYRCPCGSEERWVLESVDSAVRLQCGACKANPAAAWWLKQSTTSRRREPGAPSVADLLDMAGHFCYGCGLDVALLRAAGVSIQPHHCRRYADAGHDVPFIPLCAVCHEAVTYSQKTLRRFIRERQEAAS